MGELAPCDNLEVKPELDSRAPLERRQNPVHHMKKIEAIIRHFKLDDVKQDLVDMGLHGMTVTEVTGYGRQHGQKASYRGNEYVVDFVPKIKLELVVPDERLQAAVDAIVNASKTGNVGDGKVFVFDLADAIRVRTSERGDVAL